jgi:hypothetical protein
MLRSCLLSIVLVIGCGGSHTSQQSQTQSPPAVSLTAVRLAPRTIVLAAGQTVQLSVLGLYSDGEVGVLGTNTLVWQSLNAQVATITSDGLVQARAVGQVNVEVSTPLSKLSTTVTVADAVPDDFFTLILLPDPQFYAAAMNGGTPGMYRAQTWWATKIAETERVRAVISLGDNVNCGDSSTQWNRALAAYQYLRGTEIPFAPIVGNHDYDDECKLRFTRALVNYNQHFGPATFTDKAWYSGNSYPTDSNANFYITFQSNGRKYLILALEFFPRDEVLPWAQSILDANPGHEVILVTHAYMNIDGRRSIDTDQFGAQFYELSRDNSGEELWQKFVRRNGQIIGVFSGHFRGVSRRSDSGDHGNEVPQILSNYQQEANGGNAFLRVVRVYPALNLMRVSTYSPYLEQFRTDEANQFEVKYGPSTVEP